MASRNIVLSVRKSHRTGRDTLTYSAISFLKGSLLSEESEDLTVGLRGGSWSWSSAKSSKSLPFPFSILLIFYFKRLMKD